MRGKRLTVSADGPAPGLIPAHAGKTCSSNERSIRFRAHPRACGENDAMMITIRPPAGSSPRMRGKLLNQIYAHCEARLIPAHAGKTVPFVVVHGMPRAHPRACGENVKSLAN